RSREVGGGAEARTGKRLFGTRESAVLQTSHRHALWRREGYVDETRRRGATRVTVRAPSERNIYSPAFRSEIQLRQERDVAICRTSQPHCAPNGAYCII